MLNGREDEPASLNCTLAEQGLSPAHHKAAILVPFEAVKSEAIRFAWVVLYLDTVQHYAAPANICQKAL